MSFDTEHLYNLLPAIYRTRDAEQGKSLKALLSVIAEQVGVLEENLEQLYDDHFIETCSEWVVPYIGDLIGYRSLHNKPTKYLSSRAEVANTIKYRRRKGTATMLEQLAWDVTGWKARVVEFFQLLATTQYMNHIRPKNFYSPDLRDREALAMLNTPFDRIAHTLDVRRISSGTGKYNIPNIGIFLWRIQDYSVTESPAVPLDDRRFFFSPLGIDTQLFTNPVPEDDIFHLAERVNVPDPISRRIMARYLKDYYGKHEDGELKSILIFKDKGGEEGCEEVPVEKIIVCDLSDKEGGNNEWIYIPPDGEARIAIDPVLGRIAFSDSEKPAPDEDMKVTYHYGFSHDMGGGEYDRSKSFEKKPESVEQVVFPRKIIEALSALGGSSGLIEIGDSGRYIETPSISALSEAKIELRAADGIRPTLVLEEDLEIKGGTDSVVILNGLLITGGKIVVPKADNNLRLLRLQHCTLVPGISLDHDGTAQQPDAESLSIESPTVKVEIDHCIVGGLRIVEGAEVKIANSIIDATNREKTAYSGLDGSSAGGLLEIVNSTVLGRMHTRMLKLASNTIFISPVESKQKQTGCVRFSFVPEGSRLPRRYRCQPDLAVQKAITAARKEKENLGPSEKAGLAEKIISRIKPEFTSLEYGHPGYAQLVLSCPAEIRAGAEDESEMGAFHDLYQLQRETNLRIRLDEYLRFSLEAGIFYST